MQNKKHKKKASKAFLKEAESINRPQSMADFAPTDVTQISLDQAIDRYFIQYERESIPTSEIFEEKNVSGLMNYLFEQDLDLDADLDEPAEEDAEPAADDDLGLDDSFGDDSGEEEVDPPPPPVMNTPQIDLQDFARSVSRLVNNVEALIDVRSIILNRAKAYIRSNYNERTAVEMMDILDKQWNLKPVESENSANEMPKFPQPRAGVTGPAGG